MKDVIKLLISLQEADSRILAKRSFINKVPMRIYEVDEPLKQAKAELDKMKHKSESLTKKRREKEKMLEETVEKIKKMKSRASELKTNKEYQAHLKEIESSEKEIGVIEEQILVIMEDLDSGVKELKDKEEGVNKETAKLAAFKKKLDEEVVIYENELTALKEERAKMVALIDTDVYKTYMFGLNAGGGVAVTGARNEICMGCNMNIPPQLFVEIKKNEEIIQCPQCRRILYYTDEQ